MTKIQIDLPSVADVEPDEKVSTQVRDIAEYLPNPHRSDIRAKLRRRTQMNFPRVPVFVKEQFDAAAAELNMNKVEFFYHCLRTGGNLDIPPYAQMDLRKT